jgi:ubiquinone/menaquinone biosynthesis C-methylase UbiE
MPCGGNALEVSVHVERVAVDRWKSLDQAIMKYIAGVYDFALESGNGKRLCKALPHVRGPKVLEVSFGVGFLISQYADKYDVTGVDYNTRCIELTQKRLKRMGKTAKLMQGDAHALPFPDASFDTVINTDAFSIYTDPEKAMSEALRVLVPGGRMIMMEYDYPKDHNLLGVLCTIGIRRVLRMAYFDFCSLVRNTGYPYRDHAVGGFGCLHMFIIDKPVEAQRAQLQANA